MAGNVKNMGLTSLDDLFKSEQERQQDTHERILNIPVGEIHPYARQPYSVERPTPDLVRLKERALCKRIEQQVPGIQQNLREFEENKSQNQKEVIRHEYQRRNR